MSNRAPHSRMARDCEPLLEHAIMVSAELTSTLGPS